MVQPRVAEVMAVCVAKEKPNESSAFFRQILTIDGKSDKIIVLTKRPGTVKEIINLDFPKDSTPLARRSDIKFNNYFKQLWEALQ